MMRLIVEVEGDDLEDVALAIWSIDSQIEDEGATEGQLRANRQRVVWWIEEDVEPLERSQDD